MVWKAPKSCNAALSLGPTVYTPVPIQSNVSSKIAPRPINFMPPPPNRWANRPMPAPILLMISSTLISGCCRDPPGSNIL